MTPDRYAFGVGLRNERERRRKSDFSRRRRRGDSTWHNMQMRKGDGISNQQDECGDFFNGMSDGREEDI
jgi:hypothetical protein